MLRLSPRAAGLTLARSQQFRRARRRRSHGAKRRRLRCPRGMRAFRGGFARAKRIRCGARPISGRASARGAASERAHRDELRARRSFGDRDRGPQRKRLSRRYEHGTVRERAWIGRQPSVATKRERRNSAHCLRLGARRRPDTARGTTSIRRRGASSVTKR